MTPASVPRPATGPHTPPTGLVVDPAFLEHETGPGHPERPDRARAVQERLERSGLAAELDAIGAPEATLAMLERVHAPGYPESIRREVEAVPHGGLRRLSDGDTTVSPGSWRAALRAAGGACEAARRVVEGSWGRAFVVARPPGHHAERDRAMGFCLFNNIAVTAAHLRHELGVDRVAILDWDVHHGNGTQHLFDADPDVFYASLHQWPLYPGTGAASERGQGDGVGTVLNRPQEPGAGDVEWIRALEDEVLPAIADFAPDVFLISAGFDAHRDDPLAGTRVTTAGFARMTELVTGFAHEHCAGRLVSLLEGGYDLDALADSVEAHVAGLRSA